MTWMTLAPVVASVHGARMLFEGWRAYRADDEDFTDLRNRLAHATLVVGLGFTSLLSPMTAAILLVGFTPGEVVAAWKALGRKPMLSNTQATEDRRIG